MSMAEQATGFVQEGVDRFNAARDRLDDELQRVQKDLTARRKRLEREIGSRRKSFEKQTRKQVKQIRSELKSNWFVKRAEDLRSEATRQIEGVRESVLQVLSVASKHDVQKIDRKLTKIHKRLKDIERVRSTNGQQNPARL
jgi:hypothetical protein